jgi:hypothetical protein
VASDVSADGSPAGLHRKGDWRRAAERGETMRRVDDGALFIGRIKTFTVEEKVIV